ncbi:MAG TPA: peptidylprolyl isomerase [Blastocatellia bacterium]|nr:peptidylprolyl isomerase [Blastocatellia bacterium]
MKTITPLLTLCLVVCAAACRGSRNEPPVIAVVNGREISRAEFERFLALKMGEFTSSETPDALRSQMFDEFITRRLVLDAATQAGVAITEEEVRDAAQENPQMKSAAATEDNREELINDLLVEKYYRQVLLRDVRVSPEEKQQYIEQNQHRLTDRPGFYVREIRVQSREEAEKLRRRVTDEHQDFAAVARLHSLAPNAEQGGLARYDEGQLPQALDRAIRPLRPGDISPVIESSYGFHIFKLERRVQPVAPEERRAQFDERRARLAEELVARRNQQAIDEALERLRAAAAIEIRDAALGFTYTGRLRQN